MPPGLRRGQGGTDQGREDRQTGHNESVRVATMFFVSSHIPFRSKHRFVSRNVGVNPKWLTAHHLRPHATTQSRPRYPVMLATLLVGLLVAAGCSPSQPEAAVSTSSDEPTSAASIGSSSTGSNTSRSNSTGTNSTGTNSTASVGSGSVGAIGSTLPVRNSGKTGTAAIGSSDCRFTPPDVAGEVTFVVNGRLQYWNQTGVHCLSSIGDEVSRVQWNPTGTNALLNGDRVLVGDGGTKTSGFLAQNTTVRWSYPNGHNLIGVAGNGDLAKRDIKTAQRTVLASTLTKINEVAYQPAGTSVTVIGEAPIDDDPGHVTKGVWALSNIGGQVTQLVVNETAERVWDLHYDAEGLNLYFLAEHPVADDHPEPVWHVHLLDRTAETEGLTEAFTSTEKLDHLVVSEFGTGWVSRSALRASGETTYAATSGSRHFSRSSTPVLSNTAPPPTR